MSHTPGPWIVFNADESGPADVLPAGRPGCIASAIANAYDARLISLAPLMFRVLKDVSIHGAPPELRENIAALLNAVEPR